MASRKKTLRYLIWAGIILLQVIMTQFVTFVASMPFPKGMEGYPQSHPVIFVVFLGITYSVGVFYTGWVAIKKRWISVQPKFRLRLVCTLAGAYIPLILALLLYHPLEPGNPFFFIAIFTCILGFYVPGWLRRPLSDPPPSTERARNLGEGEAPPNAEDEWEEDDLE